MNLLQCFCSGIMNVSMHAYLSFALYLPHALLPDLAVCVHQHSRQHNSREINI